MDADQAVVLEREQGEVGQVPGIVRPIALPRLEGWQRLVGQERDLRVDEHVEVVHRSLEVRAVGERRDVDTVGWLDASVDGRRRTGRDGRAEPPPSTGSPRRSTKPIDVEVVGVDERRHPLHPAVAREGDQPIEQPAADALVRGARAGPRRR